MSKKKIVSIIDRPRYGLREHAEALSDFWQKSESGVSILLVHKKIDGDLSDRYSIRNVFRQFQDSGDAVFVVWSVGLTYMLMPILSRIYKRKRFVVVLHEPGGLKQRIKKGDPLIYSLFVSIFELFMFVSDVDVVVPNKKNALIYGYKYAPLIFSREVSQSKVYRSKILYLGRKSEARCLSFFQGQSLVKFMQEFSEEVSFEFFPNEKGNSTQYKKELMSTALCVVNCYTVQHNQSGVTPDSLRHGVPVIVSDTDAFCDDIIRFNAGVVIPLNELNLVKIAEAVKLIISSFDFYHKGAVKMYDELFGECAYNDYWRPVIN